MTDRPRDEALVERLENVPRCDWRDLDYLCRVFLDSADEVVECLEECGLAFADIPREDPRLDDVAGAGPCRQLTGFEAFQPDPKFGRITQGRHQRLAGRTLKHDHGEEPRDEGEVSLEGEEHVRRLALCAGHA